MKLIKIPSGFVVKGCEKAPDKIIEQLRSLFLNESGFNVEFDIDEVIISDDCKKTADNIHNKIKQSIKQNEKAIILGGDHSITFSAFKAFAEQNPGAGIVIFDAHPDCDNKFMPPGHDDLLIALIRQKIVEPKKILLVGVRNWTGNEKEFLELHNIRCIKMREIQENGIREACDFIMETAREWPAFYLSIDIDAVDPAFAPGTGYREPGGLTSREMIYFVQRLKMLKNLKIADITEVNPPLDAADLTTKLAAKLVKELS